MQPEIDRALNLVFPVRSIEKPDPKDTNFAAEERAQRTIVEPVLWVYHHPVSEALFRQYFRVIAATKDAIFRKGVRYAATTGVTVADYELLEAAKNVAIEYQADDVGPLLISELRRLTFVLAPKTDGTGFEEVPVDIAIKRGTVSADEWHDAECVIIFFTCASTMVLRVERSLIEAKSALLFKGSMTSLSPTDYLASLATSTPGAISEITTALSVPS